MSIFDIDSTSGLHILWRREVYLSGEFISNKSELKGELEKDEVGAIVVPEPANCSVVVLGGNNPLADVDEVIKDTLWNVWGIVIMKETELRKILEYGWHKEDLKSLCDRLQTLKNKAHVKNLKLSYELLFNPVYSLIAHFTDDENAPTLEGKEVFMLNADDKDDIRTDPIKLFLEQRMGAKVTAAFSPRTTDYCLLRERTINSLREGKKEDFIDMIETRCKAFSQYEFHAKFLLESEVLALMNTMGQE